MVPILNIGINGVLMGLVYALMALGLSVIFGVTRVVNFAHGEMMALGVFLAVLLFNILGWDPILSAPLIASGFFCLGYGLQRGLVNRLLDRPEHVQFIVLAAVALILLNLQLIAFGPEAQSAFVSYSLDSIQFGPLLIDTVRIYTGITSILATGALFFFFKFSLIGKAIRACADNRLGALVIGLNDKKLYAISFGLGAACIGISGCLLSVLMDISPAMGPELTLLGFVIVIIGGLGNMTGALLGGILIGLIEAYTAYFLQASLKSLFSFSFLILILLFRPQGLIALKSEG